MVIEDFIVPPDMTMVDVMKKIDKNAKGIVYVCDPERKLLGAISDGDIRRRIIHTGKLDGKAREIMKPEPIVLSEAERELALVIMDKHAIRSVPIIDELRRLREIRFLKEGALDYKKKINAPVVIMAGGKGSRLQPYTTIIPKPLIPVGEKTITEHIIDRFKRSGCKEFEIIVNYKKHLIEAYFKDTETDYDISFVEEEEFLGTAGGLRLLMGRYEEDFFMTNCDIIIEEDYSKIMDYHKENNNLATIVCAVKNMKLPYGVIETSEGGFVSAIHEKPDISSMVNTGLYVLSPHFLERIPEGQVSQITDVLQSCIDDGQRIGMYPVSGDKWMDMGQFEELKIMTERLEEIS